MSHLTQLLSCSNEFLPALLGPYAPNLDDFHYDESYDPRIANEFSTGKRINVYRPFDRIEYLLETEVCEHTSNSHQIHLPCIFTHLFSSPVTYRFGHSMLSGNLLLADQQGPFGTKALRDIFFNPGFFETPEHVDYIIGGFLHQLAQEIDNEIVDDVRNFLFSAPNGDDTCLDLASLNIHRGRDHGMLSYNGIREAMGLPRKVSFAEVTSNVELQAKLASVYTDVDAIDGWVGALAEGRLVTS